MADRFYDVPPGTVVSTCAGKRKGGACEKPVYWIEYPGKDRKTGKPKTVRNPIDCSVPGGQVPTATLAGRGVSHYATCPDTGSFRR